MHSGQYNAIERNGNLHQNQFLIFCIFRIKGNSKKRVVLFFILTLQNRFILY